MRAYHEAQQSNKRVVLAGVCHKKCSQISNVKINALPWQSELSLHRAGGSQAKSARQMEVETCEWEVQSCFSQREMVSGWDLRAEPIAYLAEPEAYFTKEGQILLHGGCGEHCGDAFWRRVRFLSKHDPQKLPNNTLFGGLWEGCWPYEQCVPV